MILEAARYEGQQMASAQQQRAQTARCQAMQFREAIDRDVEDLRGLADRIAHSHPQTAIGLDVITGLAACGNDYGDQERQLDAAAWSLRKTWLALAHRPADATPKSPCAGQQAHVADGSDVDFGYERDLDASVLESRGAAYASKPAGWSADLVICRSGQAALANLLQFVVGRCGGDDALSIGHVGAYFETRSLLDAWPRRVLRRAPREAHEVDVLLVEPIWCDGRFGVAADLPKARRALFVDTTMVGPAHDLGHYLAYSPLVVAYSSGLKLDQAGLELANVGIVRIFARDRDAQEVGSRLRRLRALTGTGLTLDELSALSAPWFMDRDYIDRYTAAIFANNRALAGTIGPDSAVFEASCHPSLIEAGADAPFCALTLRAPSRERYRRLAMLVEDTAERRRLTFARGGSFGFRGHRFELIEPEIGQGQTFLRVALGWRDGFSRQGICDLFAEIAAKPALLD